MPGSGLNNWPLNSVLSEQISKLSQQDTSRGRKFTAHGVSLSGCRAAFHYHQEEMSSGVHLLACTKTKDVLIDSDPYIIYNIYNFKQKEPIIQSKQQ